MSARSILLRLSNDGEPIVSDSIKNGVLTFPAATYDKSHKLGDAIFELQIKLNAAAKVSRNGVFHINVPANSSDQFVRSKFQKIPIESSFHKDITITIPIFNPGPYSFYTTFKNQEGSESETDHFYFVVPPNLTINGDYIPFNAINIESVISKWIGPLENWNSFFNKVSNKGYNFIHFTPLQERGDSDSPYSIYDQLRFDPKLFKSNDEAKKVISDVLNKNNLLSITDVVLNHTANNSEWLKDFPDAGYNEETAPHLKAAIGLDTKLLEFSDDLAKLNLPTDIKNSQDLDFIINGINDHVLQPLKLWQYYVFDKKSHLDEIKNVYYHKDRELPSIDIPGDIDTQNLKALANFTLQVANANLKVILNDRYSNKLDPEKLLSILITLFQKNDIEFDQIASKTEQIIDEINSDLYSSYDDDINSIKNQLKDRIRYLRLDDNGPQLGEITKDSKLTEAYFTRFKGTNDNKVWALANNGWIWGGNPLVDFASDQSKAYLRREVIVWSDCVKLRYGDKYEDSPHLWDRMIQYTKENAAIFSGFRIDNCHSTPLHVGETLLDAARSVNPNLYVVAELFSGSEEMDKIFVERLGLTSLIREAMQAWSVGELSRLVHKHGGRPIGSLTWLPLDEFAYPADSEPKASKFESSSEIKIPGVLTSNAPHALFMDCTHDNETPAQKRTVEDTLPNSALVAFCSSAIGSVFGYDECYPHLLNVVSESRQYNLKDIGIGEVKKKLHAIRKSLALETEDASADHEMYIHHEGQYITIQRYNSRTGDGWFLIARSKFSPFEGDQILSPVVLSGSKAKSEFTYTLKKTGEHQHDDKFITGIPVKVEELPSPSTEFDEGSTTTTIKIDESFIPGSIAVFSTQTPKVDASLDKFVREGAIEASKNLDLYDLNALLYRCEAEERDASGGLDGTYYIPTYGNLVYAGLEGWNLILKKVIWNNDLGSPICDHLRDGEWALDYVVDRLDKYVAHSKHLGQFQDWLRSRIDAIRVVPYFLRPHYFALVIGTAYEAARFRVLRQLDDNIKVSTNFIQSLALTSIQMVGFMNNTSLKPKEKIASVAAGLPHFSNDYMRCWGRDVFISFRGMFIVTGRYEDARQHILGFAQTLKHGMIPNLLDAGRNPRYNARDAAWFFIQAIQEYVTHIPDGYKILDEKVKRRFPLDDHYVTWDSEEAFSYETSIRDIIYEILSRHASGIKYREANAGPNLDSQMKDEGFNVEVHIDWETGLVHGGSQLNCGTWQDKMGESERAGNKGIPGTPRDGAAIELQGLLKSALRFVNHLRKKKLFDYTEVTKQDGSKISLDEWENLIQENFERCFYVPEDASQDDEFVIDGSIVNRRGIYKDLFQSGKPYEDYQLRSNFPIAMCVAPELFTPSRALGAIQLADKVLRGPVGMATLDPSDWNYRPYYLNGVDNDDFATSKGRNYHQGPEWVWLIGYFFRAFLYFNHIEKTNSQYKEASIEILTALNERLQGHMSWIKTSPWAGLTELTQKNGELCGDSSPTQAWSSSCLLDLYYDLWTNEQYHK